MPAAILVRGLVPVLLLSLATTGCRSVDPSIELLESELRWKEDQILMLSTKLDRLGAQLASCRNNNQVLRRELQQSADRERPTSDSTRGDAIESNLGGGARDEPEDLDAENLTVPRINLGEPASDGSPVDPSEDRLRTLEQPLDDVLPLPGDSSDPFEDDDASHSQPGGEHRPVSGEASMVERIVLNRHLTGGYDHDRQPGDEGLMVVVEPRDAAGRYVPVPAELSVVVRDPRQPGLAGRVARWDFGPDELVPYLKTSLFGRGIHLELPWPADPPQSTQLRVIARYILPDGRRLEAEREIRIDLGANVTPVAQLPMLGADWKPTR